MRTKLLPKGNKASDLSYTYNKERLKIINEKDHKELFKIGKFKVARPRTDTNLHRKNAKMAKDNVNNENDNLN